LHFYQLFKQHELIGYREFKLEDFRNIFELKEKYKVFSNLRVRMIEPSLSEINEKTDLTVSFIPLTKGKKIVGLRFEISGQSKNIKTVKSEKSSSKKSEKNYSSNSL
jgi:plasmid replication initiation protein